MRSHVIENGWRKFEERAMLLVGGICNMEYRISKSDIFDIQYGIFHIERHSQSEYRPATVCNANTIVVPIVLERETQRVCLHLHEMRERKMCPTNPASCQQLQRYQHDIIMINNNTFDLSAHINSLTIFAQTHSTLVEHARDATVVVFGCPCLWRLLRRRVLFLRVALLLCFVINPKKHRNKRNDSSLTRDLPTTRLSYRLVLRLSLSHRPVIRYIICVCFFCLVRVCRRFSFQRLEFGIDC